MSTTNGQPPVRGRNKYEQWLTEDGLAKLQAWARNGLTDEQIAHNCGVSRKTLAQWKLQHGDIGAALKEGKDAVDQEVENALFKSACGYDYREVTEQYDGQGVLIDRKVFNKHQAPNTVAQIYWLKNRRRDVWKENHDKTEIERERLELDKRKVEADLQEKTDNQARTIEVIISDQAKEWGK